MGKYKNKGYTANELGKMVKESYSRVNGKYLVSPFTPTNRQVEDYIKNGNIEYTNYIYLMPPDITNRFREISEKRINGLVPGTNGYKEIKDKVTRYLGILKCFEFILKNGNSETLYSMINLPKRYAEYIVVRDKNQKLGKPDTLQTIRDKVGITAKGY